jgi:hypothetical protein
MPLAEQISLSVVVSVVVAVVPFLVFLPEKEKGPFVMDPHGQEGAFLPIMDRYLKLADGLWALVIVTLGYIASPIILHEVVPYDPEHLGSLTLVNTWPSLVMCFLCVFFFKVLLVIWYEAYRHDPRSYSKFRYTVIRSLPIAAFANLLIGYGIIILDVSLWIHNGGGGPPHHYF